MREEPAGRDLGAAKATFSAVLPDRLADRWVELHAPQRWTNPALEALERTAHHWEVRPSGTEGYDKAEVTAGGVDTTNSRRRRWRVVKCRGYISLAK